jgi:ABC-type sugar transport system ATPase subunit
MSDRILVMSKGAITGEFTTKMQLKKNWSRLQRLVMAHQMEATIMEQELI